MTIQAINSVRNNYAGIKFEGRKKDNATQPVQTVNTSTLKAVPLAVMLAMSPLNKVQSENNTVKNADKDKTEVVATPQQPQRRLISKKYVTFARILPFVGMIQLF